MNVEKKDGVSVITLSGKLKTEAVQAMRQELYDYCGSKPGDVLVDMSRVKFVSSYLIGILVGCHRLLKDSGHRLHLAGLDSHLRTVLEVSGLTDVFPQHETEAAGVAHLRTGDPG